MECDIGSMGPLQATDFACRPPRRLRAPHHLSALTFIESFTSVIRTIIEWRRENFTNGKTNINELTYFYYEVGKILHFKIVTNLAFILKLEGL